MGFIVILSFFLMGYVFVKKEIKNLTKTIDDAELSLTVEKGKIDELAVNIQKYSAEERIVSFAKDSLNLIRTDQPFDTIDVDENKILKIEQLVNSKYDKL